MTDIDTRFWMKVDRSGGFDECWPWTARQYTSGYGQFWVGDRLTAAHRFAYELDRGHPPPPERPLVCHRCDNPPCCNARHLFSGTHTDNAADRDAKGRNAVGERNGKAKLTEPHVREIRERYADGETPTALGLEFGVGPRAIHRIVRGESWRSVR